MLLVSDQIWGVQAHPYPVYHYFIQHYYYYYSQHFVILFSTTFYFFSLKEEKIKPNFPIVIFKKKI